MSFKFELPDLPYDYDALEPYIDERTMRIHHDRHHQGYTNKFNNALEEYEDLHDRSAKEILSNLDDVPSEIRTAVRNNGGGYYNHSLFWPSMSSDGGGEPRGSLGSAIKDEFGGFAEFKQRFNKAASGVFGSGWAWLVSDNGKLDIVQTKNQDNPISDGKEPLLGIDVWEHAYYLNYQNKRGEYIDAWWNVINWDEVEKRLKQAD